MGRTFESASEGLKNQLRIGAHYRGFGEVKTPFPVMCTQALSWKMDAQGSIELK